MELVSFVSDIALQVYFDKTCGAVPRNEKLHIAFSPFPK